MDCGSKSTLTQGRKYKLHKKKPMGNSSRESNPGLVLTTKAAASISVLQRHHEVVKKEKHKSLRVSNDYDRLMMRHGSHSKEPTATTTWDDFLMISLFMSS